MSKREVDYVTRQRIAEHVRWWVAKVPGRRQVTVYETLKEKGYELDDGTISRVYRGAFVSLGLDVFLALQRGLEIDAHHMLNFGPLWDEVPLERRRLKSPDEKP